MRAVMLHDAAHAAAALAAAREVLPDGMTLALLSAPAAALYLTPRLFLAMTGPATPTTLPVLDCGRASGHALAALRVGCPALVLSADCPAFPALSAAAAEAGALLLPKAPPALNMAALRPGNPYHATLLRDWLAGGLPAGAAR